MEPKIYVKNVKNTDPTLQKTLVFPLQKLTRSFIQVCGDGELRQYYTTRLCQAYST
jgi:hypothetical protein